MPITQTVGRAGNASAHVGQVQVNDGRTDAAVAHEFFYGEKVHPILQHMGSKRMAEAVYGYFLGNPRDTKPLCQCQIYRIACYGRQILLTGKEQAIGVVRAVLEPIRPQYLQALL